MRVNRFLAAHTGISRRAADEAIEAGRVQIGETAAVLGQLVSETDKVLLDGQEVVPRERSYILLNKPAGYVTSRRRQGKTPTIYELLPPELHHLKPVGRLDKDSCGLLILTDDGELAQELTHPGGGKIKTYLVRLDKAPDESDLAKLRAGVELEDGLSRMEVSRRGDQLEVKLGEGRNRQIRRSFAAVGYKVTRLERTAIGQLGPSLRGGEFRELKRKDIR